VNERYEQCGYCSGQGLIHVSMFDCEGRRIAQEPPVLPCPYCHGDGKCWGGSKLLPAESRAAIIRRQEGL